MTFQAEETVDFAVKQCDALLKCYTAELLEMDRVRFTDSSASYKQVRSLPV